MAQRGQGSTRAPSDLRTSRRAIIQAAGAGTLAMAGFRAVAPSAGAMPASAHRQDGSEINVFPRHGSLAASPYTEISFRGASVDDLGTVTVIGSVSGGHSGRMMPHADGNGVSYVPDSRFDQGEEVTVQAEIALSPESDGLTFTVSRPAFSREAPSDIITDDPRVPPHEYRSRPDLRPPVFEITTPPEGTDDGHIFLGARVTDGQSGALIIDDEGEPVWFSLPASPLDAHYDVRVQMWGGEPVLTFAEANVRGPNGWRRGHYVICDTSCERIAEFGIGNGFAGGDHHEFLITPEGTAVVGTYHPVHWDLSPFGGSENGIVVDNIIQELEVESGRVLFEWHSLDHIAIDESYSSAPTDSNGQFDYLHMNSIDVDPEGHFVMNARHTFAAYRIDRHTGDLLWRLNGRQSDFEMGDGTPFAYSHDARLHDGGMLTLFDNATSDPNFDGQSRGIAIQLDTEAMTATLAQEYLHPTGIVSVSQANTQVLPNGNVFVGWGSAPVFSEFTADGELIFNGRFPRGGTSYRAYRFPWTGQPAAPPDIAVETGAGGPVVYASWNGATEVASWQVVAGDTPDTLAPTGDPVPRDGFETAIPVDAEAAWYGAQALDADGNVLGSSDPVEPGG